MYIYIHWAQDSYHHKHAFNVCVKPFLHISWFKWNVSIVFVVRPQICKSCCPINSYQLTRDGHSRSNGVNYGGKRWQKLPWAVPAVAATPAYFSSSYFFFRSATKCIIALETDPDFCSPSYPSVASPSPSFTSFSSVFPATYEVSAYSILSGDWNSSSLVRLSCSIRDLPPVFLSISISFFTNLSALFSYFFESLISSSSKVGWDSGDSCNCYGYSWLG